MSLALLSALAPAAFGRIAHAASTGLINPPQGPMRFSRRLERSMVDNAKIIVTREFTVRFSSAVRGFRIDGQQSAVKVEAPDELAPFARIEEARVETMLLPIMLGHDGMIRATPDAAGPAPSLDSVMQLARDHIASSSLSAEAREEAMQVIAMVHQAGSLITSQLPVDVFVPPFQTRVESQTIALPTGETGTVSTQIGGERDESSGLMRHATRRIVTQINSDSRVTLERWELEEI